MVTLSGCDFAAGRGCLRCFVWFLASGKEYLKSSAFFSVRYSCGMPPASLPCGMCPSKPFSFLFFAQIIASYLGKFDFDEVSYQYHNIDHYTPHQELHFASFLGLSSKIRAFDDEHQEKRFYNLIFCLLVLQDVASFCLPPSIYVDAQRKKVYTFVFPSFLYAKFFHAISIFPKHAEEDTSAKLFSSVDPVFVVDVA
ncbi:hypothetical protein VNO77_18681 [Canavalia gladiata]|uniref:Uncharacterized protein n=1 Tax=Canavalia gladiata TaxID=3824 RepID=A0AAN9LL92_CANGL